VPRLGTVGVAVEDAEVGGPRADGFAVLVGEDTGKLVEMREVVDGPGREELGKSDAAESGMLTATGEIGGLKVHGAEVPETFGAKLRELVEKLREGFAAAVALLSESVERLEGFFIAELEDHSGARHPVCAFAVNEVADDVESAPRFFAFVLGGPGVGKVTKKCVESGGSAREKRDGVWQVVVHGGLR
jgi:hypothetical protein